MKHFDFKKSQLPNEQDTGLLKSNDIINSNMKSPESVNFTPDIHAIEIVRSTSQNQPKLAKPSIFQKYNEH